MDPFEIRRIRSELEDLNEVLRQIVKVLPDALTGPAVPRLKTLKEHDDAILSKSSVGSVEGSRPNGIACPECGKELVDTNPSVTLTSNPPQKRVGCRRCRWIGTRLC